MRYFIHGFEVEKKLFYIVGLSLCGTTSDKMRLQDIMIRGGQIVHEKGLILRVITD
jgi:hypothetical protein